MPPKGERRRNRIVAYIRQFTADSGYPPTYREIAHGVGVASVGALSTSLAILRREGRITHTPNVSRSIRIPPSRETDILLFAERSRKLLEKTK